MDRSAANTSASAVGELPALRTAETLDQLIKATQLPPVHGQLRDDGVLLPGEDFKQGGTAWVVCLQVRDRRLDFGQREPHFAGGG